MNSLSKTLLLLIFLYTSTTSAQAPLSLGWVKSFGGLNYDKGTALYVDQAYIYSTGYFSASIDSLLSNGQEDIFVAKHSQNGDLIWMNNWGGSGSDQANCIKLQNNQIYIGGYFKDTVSNYSDTLIANGQEDIFICNYAVNGQLNWVKSFGGPGDEAINDLAIDSDGNIYACGYFEDSLTFGASVLVANNLRSIFIAKFDSNANPIWAKKASGPHYDEGMGIALDMHENIYLTGHFRDALFFDNDSLIGSSSSNEILLISYDKHGNRRWMRGMGGNYSDIGYRLCFDKQGYFYHTGWFNQEIFFDNDTILAEYPEGAEIFIGKYDTMGNRLWMKAFGGKHEEYAYALTVDPQDNLIFAGTFDSVFHVGTRDTLYSRHSTSPTDIFVASISPSGQWLWGQNIGGHKSDYCYGIALDDTGSLYMIGNFQDSSYFEPDSLVAIGDSDIFLAKFNIDSSAIVSHTLPVEHLMLSALFPNPTQKHLHLNFSYKESGHLFINVYDISGKKVSEYKNYYPIKNQVNLFDIPINHLSAGCYLLQIQINQSSETKMFVIK